jgi:hypothetical protein
MKLSDIEAFIASGVTQVEDDIKAAVAKVRAFVSSEEEKIKGEVAHLTGHGYTVTPPAPPQ